MSKLASGTVHFTVEGEFITDTARRLWAEEDEPERAMRILRCMQGITEAQILDVLEGRSKLTGTSDEGIQLEPDKHNGKTLEQLLQKIRDERDEARDERDDIVQIANGNVIMVPSHDGAREVPCRKAQLFMGSGEAGFLKDGYEFDDQPADVPERPTRTGKPTKKQRIYRKMKDSFVPRPKQDGINERAKQLKKTSDLMLQREKEREEEEEKTWEEKRQLAKARLEPVDHITTNTGWLSPDGKFYPCGYSMHAQVIWALGFTDNPNAHSAHPTGWVRLGENGINGVYIHNDSDGPPPTEVQKELVRTFCKEQGIDEPWWLRKDDDAEK